MISGDITQSAGRGRQGQEQREFDRRFCRLAASLHVARLQRPRQFRQQHHADGDADDAERQLVDAVGILQDRDRALLAPRRSSGR